ncbi:hypothetical protein [Acetobacterium wieringae]|uniref:SbsA Ig-like domain-containing protein n=1 Tax=Acetobacterium wieringae TaxID=52694 RepID=A0A1F2PDE3_9FIRM|nr:hypothetical protein [Acetobacterium wieringae]OFV68902.1 hypothetical protein ACWI_36300 [Acetobacterium wieringae]URN85233.1 hypothetical protein CHL1_000864 [Acetobacterium wieringae]
MPKVADVTVVDATRINVNYNTAMDIVTMGTASKYSVSGNTVASVEVSADHKVATLTLGTPLTNVDANTTVGVNGVKDPYNNEIKNFAKVYVLSDKVRPVAGSLVWDDSQTLSFTIDKDADLDTTNTSGNAKNVNAFVAVYDANGIKKFGLINTGTQATYVTANNQSKVTVNVAGLTAGNYTLQVVGLKDKATNLINPNPTIQSFTITNDTTAPAVTSITPVGYAGGNATFDVVFTERLQANPTIDIDDVTKAIGTPVVSADGKTYTITVTTTSGLHKVTVKNFKDLAGNSGTAVAQMVTFTASSPQLVSAQYQPTAGGNKIVVKFDRNIVADTPADITAGSYVYDNVQYALSTLTDGGKIDKSALTVADIDNDGIKELLINADDYSGTAGAVTALPVGSYTVTLPAGEVKDAAGQANTAKTLTFVVPSNASVTTTASPAAKGTAANGDANYVDVTFTQKVTDATALNLANYKVEGSQVFTNAVFTDSTKKIVRLTMAAGAIQTNGSYTVTVDNVVDTNGNAVQAFSGAVTLYENVKPFIALAEVNATNNVKVTFNEALTGTINNADLEVYVNGSKVASTVSFTSGASIANITLTTPLADTTSTVVVKTASTFSVVDANKNEAVTGFEKTAVWNVVVDTTAPTLSAISAGNLAATTADLTFTSDEAGTYYYLVYAAADAAPTAATVKAQGTAVTKGTAAATAAAQTVNMTGLTTATAYKAYVVVEDAAGNLSTVGATASFTTL